MQEPTEKQKTFAERYGSVTEGRKVLVVDDKRMGMPLSFASLAAALRAGSLTVRKGLPNDHLPKRNQEYVKGNNGELRRAEPKLGRNDPCHCGSGKKFKKCHGE